MALIDFDSWSFENTADIALHGWNNTGGTISSTAGRRGGPALQFQGGAAIYRAFTAATTTVTFGFWFQPASVSVGDTAGICLVMDVDGTKHLCITGKADGTLQCHLGNWTDTVYASTAVGTMSSLVGVFIEGELKVHATTGTLKLWINDTLTSVNYAGTTSAGGTGTPGQFVFAGAFNHYGVCNVSDYYLLDSSGSAPLNARLGSTARCDNHIPTANGNTSNSTPSTGTNRALTVDEIGSNGDTDYNTLAAAGNKDTLALTDLVPTGKQILGVQARLNAKRTATATNLSPVLRIGGTDYDGTAQATTTSYAGYRQVYSVSPATSAAFTETEFNAMEFGYKTSADAVRVTQAMVETLTITGAGLSRGGTDVRKRPRRKTRWQRGI